MMHTTHGDAPPRRAVADTDTDTDPDPDRDPASELSADSHDNDDCDQNEILHDSLQSPDNSANRLRFPAYAEWVFKYLHQNTRPRSWCLQIITWRWFERISILVIILNCVTLACYRPCEDFNKCDASYRCQILTNLDHCIFAFFVAEMTVKIIAMGFLGPQAYLSEAWNRFDFLIILVGLIEYVVSAFGQSSGINLTAIRTARVLRPLRAINRIPSLRILVTLLLDTLPMLGNVLLLCFFVFFIFGIMGVQLWSSVLRQRCRTTLNHSTMQSYNLDIDTFYRSDLEPDFLCSKPDSDGMRKCDKVPAFRDANSREKCFLSVEEFETIRRNHSHANVTLTPSSLSSFTLLNGTHNTSVTLCVDWNRYYTNCTPSDKNPFMGAISFDNIGFAWVTIFQVISLESWVDIMYSLQDTFSYWSWIYFVFLIVIGAFFMINLCLVVIATQFSETKKREIERMRQERLLSTSSLASSGDPSGGFYKQLVRLVLHYLGVVKNYIVYSCNRALGRGQFKSRSSSVLQLRKRQRGVDTVGQKPACQPNSKSTEQAGPERWAQLALKPNANGAPHVGESVELQQVTRFSDDRPEWAHHSQRGDDNCSPKRTCANTRQHAERLRGKLRHLVQHRYFQRIILLAILVNTLSMGIEHHKEPQLLTEALEYINIVFTTLFAIEMLFKLLAFGLLHYISNAFNVFDAIIVILSIVELCQDGASGISVLRTFRLLRIFKVVRFLPALKRQLIVMLRTLDNVATFFILLLIFIFVFSVLGMNLFGCQFCVDSDGQRVCDRKNFDTFLWAMVTVFQILTQEDWNSVLYMGMARTTPWASLYFVALMTFGNYVLFNLLVAILVEGFSSEKARLIESQRRAQERAEKANEANERSPSKRSSTSSVFVRDGKTSAKAKAKATATAHAKSHRNASTADVTNEAKQNGRVTISASRLKRRTPLPTIIHTPATPSHCIPLDRTSTNVLECRRTSDVPEVEDPEVRRTLSEILMSASRRPCKPFMASEVSLESIDKSVSTLNCLCSPANHSRGSRNGYSSSSAASSQLLSPTITSHGSLRLSRKSMSCATKKRRRSENDVNEEEMSCTRNCNPDPDSPTASCSSELVQIVCADQLAQQTVDDAPEGNSGRDVENATLHECNGVDSSELCADDALNQDSQCEKPLLSGNKLTSCFRVALEQMKFWLIKRREYSLYLFSERNRFRRFCQMLSSAKWFDYIILVFIIANCVALAIENPHMPNDSIERHVLALSNYVFTAVFTIEMLIKIIASGFFLGKKPYADSGWNRMDFFLVSISLIDLIVTLADGGSSRIFTILRVFRLLRTLRPLRVINRAPGLKLVVQTLLSSLKPIGNIVLICCTFFIIFGILGVQLFKGKFYHCEGVNITHIQSKNECLSYKNNQWINHQYNFDNLGQALIALFVLASKDGWVEIMYHGLDAVGEDMQPIRNYGEWRLLYFICFLLLVGFFVLNMFVGVVVENFQNCRAQQEAEDQSRKFRRRLARLQRHIKKMMRHRYWEDYPPWRARLHQLVSSKYFDLIIAGVIGLNVITMAMEFYMMPNELRVVLEVLNFVFTGIFIMEAIFRVIATGPKRYVMDKWNQLDIFIIVLSIVGIGLEDGDEYGHSSVIKVNPTIIRVFRVMRIARVLKLLKMAKGIRQLLDTVIQALPQVGNLGLLFFLLFYIFAALGVELFSRIECDEDHPCVGMGRHANFKTFGNAFLTLFRIATGDNWNGIMKDTLREKCDDSDTCEYNCCVVKFAPPLFFVVFVLVAQFVLVNVVIAVLMRHLQDAHRTAQEDATANLMEEGNIEALKDALSQIPNLDDETRRFLDELKKVLPNCDDAGNDDTAAQTVHQTPTEHELVKASNSATLHRHELID